MSYPGNASLAAVVKDRVVSTFQQTLSLFKQGRTDEVTAGCTLLLQMDPTFDPAKKLLDKVRNPALPIDVDALMPAATPGGKTPMQQAREAMASRDFQRVIHLTTSVLTEDLLNDEARILGDDAREKLEAEPFIVQFARKAQESLAAGNVAAAKMEIEKARALDPTHPEVLRVVGTIAARDTGSSRAVAPSFVVDAPAGPPASGRSAAQAADFGFTFEEDKPAATPAFSNFSFDEPVTTDFSFDKPAAPKPEAPFGGFSFDSSPAVSSTGSNPRTQTAAEFDFATAAIVTNEDDQRKIEQYLADGDRAFAAGDYSQAIDVWSRIFLIDVTNDQASERIERAKGKRQEIEQHAETILASGIKAFEQGNTAKAHTDLTEVLRLDPRNSSAQEYLDRLGETVSGARPMVPPPPSANEKLDLFSDDLTFDTYGASDSFGGESLVPPDAAPARSASTSGSASAAKPKASAEPRRKLPMGLIAVVVGVLVLGGGGWFVWSKMSGSAVESSGEGERIIGRASALAKNGRFDQAIALLRDIKPGDPKHNDAMLMIADLQSRKAASAQLIDGIPAAQYYEQKIAAAGAAFAAADYSAAKTAFEQAMRVKALPAPLKAQYDEATQQASKLDAAKALFAERKYADAIANLQPLLAADPQNASIKRMIADAHFNLGAMALQEERVADAIRELDEVLAINPGDELARRSRELAVRYTGEPKDLLYKIYVKYLPLRAAT